MRELLALLSWSRSISLRLSDANARKVYLHNVTTSHLSSRLSLSGANAAESTCKLTRHPSSHLSAPDEAMRPKHGEGPCSAVVGYLRADAARYDRESADLDDATQSPPLCLLLILTVASLTFAFIGLCAAGII